MNKSAWCLLGLGLVCVVFAGWSFGGGVECERARAGVQPYTVHEWGTFTSLQGSDGVSLEGLEREEESLPSFVYDRAKIRDCPLRNVGWKGLERPVEGVTQKMETPVIYFHSREARRVRVHVDFMQGLISQWYPVSDLLGPPEGKQEDGPLDIAKVERSFLEWEVDLLPPGAPAPSELPQVAREDDPWLFARAVDANWLRTTPRAAPARRGPVEAEKYLFYRGVGRFTLPISVSAERGGKGVIKNDGEHALPETIVLEVRGKRGRMQFIDKVPAKGETAFAHGGNEYWGPIDEIVEKLKAVLLDVLTKQGLNGDEALAMVNTWSRSWFQSEGTRVLYVVPRDLVDRMLPLTITPPPEATVRVLLGRLEYLTPEVEEEVEQALVQRVAGGDDERRDANECLARLGRFLEPHLRRAQAHTKIPAARASAEALLAEMKAEARAR